MQTTSGKIHRRKSSKDDDENTFVINITDEPASPSLSASISLSPTPTRPAPPPPRSPHLPLSISLSPSFSTSSLPPSSSSSAAIAPRSPVQPIVHARSPTSPSRENRDYGHGHRSRVHSTPAPPPLPGHSRSMSISVPSPLSSPNGFSSGAASAGLISTGPSIHNPPPSSAGPYRTSFNKMNGSTFRTSISSPQNLGVNGMNSINGHSRTRSISTPYSPPLPSPLSFSFPANPQSQSRSASLRSPTTMTTTTNRISGSSSLPENNNNRNDNNFTNDTLGEGNAAQLESQSENQKQQHNRRHSRLHSRNLSIFFPRPGSLPANTISEDGAQELEFPSDIEALPMPSAGSSVSFPSSGGRRTARSLQNGAGGTLGANFSFGGRPPSISGPTPTAPLMSNGTNGSSSGSGLTSSRRGHHHKHSLSHNFFSFLEPGTGGPGALLYNDGVEGEQELELYTQPTPTPMSPWNPISPFPKSAGVVTPGSMGQNYGHGHGHSHSHSRSQSQSQAQSSYAHFPPTPTIPSVPTGLVTSSVNSTSDFINSNINTNNTISNKYTHNHNILALPFTLFQFFLGAFLWVSGQQIGSLGTTGLGYWVVFDSLGAGVGGVMRGWLRGSGGLISSGGMTALRRPYGNARIETVLQFAQSVYLMFSSVYVCKETVEHVLLSAGGTGGVGGGDGHHHHMGDENPSFTGIQFPYILSSLAFITIILSAAMFDNHKKLVDITGNRIPSLTALVRSLTSSLLSPFTSLSSRRPQTSTITDEGRPPSSLLGMIFSNPYIVFPLAMCVAISWGGLGLDASHHRTFDLSLAGIITFVTFRVSYSASVVLGTVLLQTAPRRRVGTQKGGIGSIRGIAKNSDGKMEAFLRVMKDVEHNPQVLHLPAPHIWQFTPTPAVPVSTPLSFNPPSFRQLPMAEHLVVTLEIHVRRDLPDEDVLRLTGWAWEKCVGALTGGVNKHAVNGVKRDIGGGETVKADVTVGVVRG
ncbi:hypothetical protein J3R30DRAFT_3747324 [Lentinula aciculospora]|uniref:Uncharacterized protein n=1 Tax=Lentinula aciculospora TaxID=153920 RepID=A0A9W9ATC2_9AGAR|nr:hypothetical protein J3R30DRAFT_3747324 [Lentinula aciculospora]